MLSTQLTVNKNEVKNKRRVAWGITGCGDLIPETLEVMNEIKQKYEDEVEIRVYLSKAGEQVIKYYKLADDLKENFRRLHVEIDSNSPFLAGALQLGKFEFLLIAPTTSNTVAKISLGIADTLLSNAAIMALKAYVPVYILSSDYKERTTITKLPSGQPLKLKIRKEDVAHVKKLIEMDNVYVLEKPEDINQLFKNYFQAG
ncbi:archaeoflavoprotein AfpA [Candidatus Bathyarchaeota archaeon]|nr:archaeoflavoprotein AfpA [Candidatus Bathyarchaeota archaeon]